MLVVFQERGTRKACRELLDDFLNLVLFQPGVDHHKPLAEHWQHDYLGETLAVAVRGPLISLEFILREVKDFPTQAGKLVEQRLFDMIPLVDPDLRGGFVRAHAIASNGSDKSAVTRRLPVRRSCSNPYFKARNLL